MLKKSYFYFVIVSFILVGGRPPAFGEDTHVLKDERWSVRVNPQTLELTAFWDDVSAILSRGQEVFA